MYEDDTPPAERRAQALSLDRDLLRELLGQEELRELIDPAALAEVEASLRPLPRDRGTALRPAAPARRPAQRRVRRGATRRSSMRERRAIRVRIAGDDRLAAAEDAGRYRDALGVVPAVGPARTCSSSRCPTRFARSSRASARGRGPFTTAEASAWFGVDVEEELRESRARGEARPRRAPSRRHRARVVRSRRPAAAAARVARGPAPRGRAGGAGRARPLPLRAGTASTAARRCARRSSRCRRSRCPWRSGRRRCCRAACPTTGPSSSTSSVPPASSSGSGPGSTAWRVFFRDDAPLLGRPAGDAAAGGRGARCDSRRARRRRALLGRAPLRDRARRRDGAARARGISSGAAR